MTTDTEYRLSEWREAQKGLFDENGMRYSGTNISNRECEQMLELINNLEAEVINLEKKQNGEITDKEKEHIINELKKAGYDYNLMSIPERKIFEQILI